MHDIILAVVGCGLLNVIATAIINALSNRKGRLTALEGKVDKLCEETKKAEKDALRTQLLLMISDFPTNIEGIMTLGQRYFGVLNGDWFATSIFNTWLEQSGTARPEWFKKEE